MAIRSYFYDSVGGDRLYSAVDFAKAFNVIMRDGCINLSDDLNNLDLGFNLSGADNRTVGAGKAVVNGRFIEVLDTETITVPAGNYSGQLVIQVDNGEKREAALVVKTDRSPVKTDDLYEFPLWDLTVTGGAITGKTDKRTQGGAVAKVPPAPELPTDLVTWVPDVNGVRAVIGKFNGTGKPIVLYLTTGTPAASAAEHRVWIQIDNF